MCWFSWNCFVCSYVHFLYILWMQATGKKKNPCWLYGSVKVDFVCLLVLQWSFSCWALDWRGPPCHDVCVAFPPEPAGLDQAQLWVRELTVDSPRGLQEIQYLPRSHPPPNPPLSQFDRWTTDSTLDPGPLLDLCLSHHKWDRWKTWCDTIAALSEKPQSKKWLHCYTRSPCSCSNWDNQLSIYW